MKYIICILIFSIHFQILSWGELGHEVVAQIAWSKLTPTTKAQVEKILSLTSPFYFENKNFITASKWADLIKGTNNNFNKWHYIDLPYDQREVKIDSHNEEHNIFKAICQTVTLIKNNHNPINQAWALPMLIHLVGDIHQPLHTTSRFTEKHPKGDQGGSLYIILHQGNLISLHLYWDLGLGLLGNVGGIYFPSKIEDFSTLQIADAWMKEFPTAFFKNRISNL
ncbi:MAG: S1/P1 nuclease, partial [bacterium]|nr:S1/P1 nuclease [bacterium]